MGELSTADIVLIVMGFIHTILIFVATFLCCCSDSCFKRKKRNYKTDNENNFLMKSTESLIPPIFYTDDLKDPLRQEDLREKIPR